jgi:hypothetical protein
VTVDMRMRKSSEVAALRKILGGGFESGVDYVS